MNVKFGRNKYKINILNKPNKFMKKNNYAGYIDYVDREIFLSADDGNLRDTAIHELVHAWLEANSLHHLNYELNVETMTRMFIELEDALYENNFRRS